MATTFNVIYLGNFASLDLVEGDDFTDNAASLLNSPIGSSGAPLHDSVQEFSPGTAGYSGGIAAEYDTNNSVSNDQFTIDGGADQTMDATVVYGATITYTDGTTASVTAVIFQDTSGATYLAPEMTQNADQDALEAKPLESIELTSIIDNYAHFTADRVGGDYDEIEQVDGTSGNDSMGDWYTDGDGDQIGGNDGDFEIIDGGDGNDWIDAGAGDDVIYGGEGTDNIYGGAGDDTIYSGLNTNGYDLVEGGAGADTMYGEGGYAVVGYWSSDASVTIDLSDGSPEVGGVAEGDIIIGFEQLDGSDYNDTLTGDDTGMQIKGWDGNDLITGGAGNDRLDGGNDNDTLYGLAGNDQFWGRTGTDNMFGGDDDDIFYISSGWGNDTIDGGEGGTDFDTIDLSSVSPSVTITFTASEAGTISDGTNTVTFDNIEAIIGTDQNDTINAAAGATSIDIDGAGGDDTITGGSGADTLDGGSGHDAIHGGGGTDTIDGGSGHDELYGDAGDDTIIGGEGYDDIYGGTGDDIIDGGDDGDTIFLEDGWGEDTIDGGEGGDDWDELNLENLTSGANVTFMADESGFATSGANTAGFSNLEAIEGSGHDDVIDGAENTTGLMLAGNDGDDTLTGGSGSDSLYGDAGSDTIVAGDGNDTVYGGADNDNITGGSGGDNLFGDAGDDTIDGGSGDDTLYGGTGDDTFVMGSGDGTDTIVNFDTGDDDFNGSTNDQLDVSGLAGGTGDGGTVTAWDVVVTDDGSGNALLTFPDGEQFILQGTLPASVTSPSMLMSMGVACFGSGTLMSTPSGPRLIDDLTAGDFLKTRDNGPQQIRWVGRSTFDAAALDMRPDLRPVRINPGGILPVTRPLLVSPQHRLLLQDPRLQDICGVDEGFVRARVLATLGGTGARFAHGKRHVTYYHVLLDKHEVLTSDGAPSESYYPGPMSLRNLAPHAQRELFEIRPEFSFITRVDRKKGRDITRKIYGPTARIDLRRHHVETLLSRVKTDAL